MRSCKFWRLMFNKVTSRSYGYFLRFSSFLFEINEVLQGSNYISNYQSW
jgi:hypothetical protein